MKGMFIFELNIKFCIIFILLDCMMNEYSLVFKGCYVLVIGFYRLVKYYKINEKEKFKVVLRLKK